jgi:16S rRNA (uracil1498-N3)-methyltransferase
MNYFFQPDIFNGIHVLSPEESTHCIRVLRKKRGDSIHILDGRGGVYVCSIKEADPVELTFQVIEKKKIPLRNYSIHIGIAPTKNMERMEWFIEKSVEIGVDRISFIRCQNSERFTIKLNRLQKKAINALKQSGNVILPQLSGNLTNVKEFIRLDFGNISKYIGHAEEGYKNPLIKMAKAKHSYLILIGPEGDFTKEEIRDARESGFLPVSLSASRLRTETAGITACMTLHLINSEAG